MQQQSFDVHKQLRNSKQSKSTLDADEVNKIVWISE